MTYQESHQELTKWEYIYNNLTPLERESEYGKFVLKHTEVLKRLRVRPKLKKSC
jgi:hypothetical protein